MTALAYAPPADRGLQVRYEDMHCLVVDKPAGLLTVPGRGADKADCLAVRVQQRLPEALIVHRLDMGTSGLVLMAGYVAVVAGRLAADGGVIDLPLLTDWPNRPRQKVDFALGKPSLTCFRVLGRDAAQSRLALAPRTGRSHQLRVHLQAIGHPILGDELYAEDMIRDAAPRLLLHAERLAFVHPFGGATIEILSPPPF